MNLYIVILWWLLIPTKIVAANIGDYIKLFIVEEELQEGKFEYTISLQNDTQNYHVSRVLLGHKEFDPKVAGSGGCHLYSYPSGMDTVENWESVKSKFGKKWQYAEHDPDTGYRKSIHSLSPNWIGEVWEGESPATCIDIKSLKSNGLAPGESLDLVRITYDQRYPDIAKTTFSASVFEWEMIGKNKSIRGKKTNESYVYGFVVRSNKQWETVDSRFSLANSFDKCTADSDLGIDASTINKSICAKEAENIYKKGERIERICQRKKILKFRLSYYTEKLSLVNLRKKISDYQQQGKDATVLLEKYRERDQSVQTNLKERIDKRQLIIDQIKDSASELIKKMRSKACLP